MNHLHSIPWFVRLGNFDSFFSVFRLVVAVIANPNSPVSVTLLNDNFINIRKFIFAEQTWTWSWLVKNPSLKISWHCQFNRHPYCLQHTFPRIKFVCSLILDCCKDPLNYSRNFISKLFRHTDINISHRKVAATSTTIYLEMYGDRFRANWKS